jgi:thiamine-monophosphate kinase
LDPSLTDRQVWSASAVVRRITSETELIATYLAPLTAGLAGARGLRDDAATLSIPADMEVVVTTDPVREGVHFFSQDKAADIAWKALSVNVSDLAAKGATPFAYTMALGFPEAPCHDWMSGFASGLADAQLAFGCHLAGGDTDRVAGPLSIAITAFGLQPKGSFVPRHGAEVGDHVFVSGTIGDAALGLALHQDGAGFGQAELDTAAVAELIDRYLRPKARAGLAAVIRDHARAALDVSDGLVRDLGRLIGAHCALDISTADIPLSAAAQAVTERPDVWPTLLTGGGDYEILAAVAPEKRAAFTARAAAAGIAVSELGRLRNGAGELAITHPGGAPLAFERTGFDHFG